MTDASCRVVVLVSGEGTNLQALLDAGQRGILAADIVAVISNRPEAPALTRARRAGVAAECIDHKAYADRPAFDGQLAACIDRHRPDLVVMAGFMRILGGAFIGHFAGRMLNVHPSLLPKYRGLHTHQRVLEAGDPWHGSTVHFVTGDLDGGPVVLQGRLRVRPDDTPESLSARVQALEHNMYPVAVRWYAQGRLQYREGAAWLDGEPLPPAGVPWQEDLT